MDVRGECLREGCMRAAPHVTDSIAYSPVSTFSLSVLSLCLYCQFGTTAILLLKQRAKPP